MTWVQDGAFRADQPFGPQTLPYGVVDGQVAVRLGDQALPLRPIASSFGAYADAVSAPSLDPLLAAGRQAWTEVRARLIELVNAPTAPRGASLVPLDGAVLPFTVGDYVDFFSSKYHAENAGKIFRPNDEPLMPNWTHLPVGYHGRSGTVVVSGTPVTRPNGQQRGPAFGPSQRLDIEAEVGFVCGGPPTTRVSTSDAADHVFGVVLVNDWSARDIQGWEAQPLGPFLAKSFATSVSAWITPLDAFSAARVHTPPRVTPLFDYLREDQPWGLDLLLQIDWNGTIVSRPRFADMYYTFAQQLAHMTVNGASLRPGDFFASGTVSGPEREQLGCFLELSWGGRDKISLGNGEHRTFLEDGDTVRLTATAPGPDGSVVGLSDVTGTVLAAVP
ncbi:MAG: fumarylacetoacetate hydrolase family protein [Kibdelosporangium sp.]